MKRFIVIKFIIGLLFFNLNAFAENYESTVFAKKIRKSDQLELNSDELHKNASSSFSDFLNYNSPLHFEFTLIAPPQWSIRGANSSHTLFTVDGNPIFDPSTIQGTWDLNLWPNSWIKNTVIDFSPLEGVLKWGGQASGAVIAVESADTDQYHLTFDSKKSASADLSKSWHSNQILLFGQNNNIRSPFENSKETYKMESVQALAKVEIPLKGSSPLRAFLLTGRSFRTLPEWTQDSKTFYSDENHQILNLNWNPKIHEVSQNYNIQANQFQRKYLNTNESNLLNEAYLGSGFYFRYDLKFQMTNLTQLHFGFNNRQEQIKLLNNVLENLNRQMDQFSSFVGFQHQFENNIGFNFGGRSENSKPNQQMVLNPAASVFGDGWSIAAFKSARNPSLFQIYDPVAGNINLLPEKILNNTAEIHGEILTNQYQFVFFERSSKNAVDYDLNTFRYENIVKTHTKGLEAHLNVPIYQGEWHLIATLQNSRNQNNQKMASDQIITSTWNYLPSEQNQWQLATVWNSENQAKSIPSYSVWNLAWLAQKHWNIAIHNLTQTKVVKNKQYLIEDRTINFEYSSDF